MRYFIFFIILSGGFIFLVHVRAQQINCIASVNPKDLSVGDTLYYSIQVTGPQAEKSEIAELPVPDGLEWISTQPATATRKEIINGVQQSSKTFFLTLRAITAGFQKIGQAKIRYQNRVLLSNEIAITIYPYPYGDWGYEKDHELLFRIETGRKEIYAGEPLIVDFNLYTRYPVDNLHIVRMPNFTGFWTEEIPINDHTVQTALIGQTKYRVFTIRRLLLFPMYAGHLKIDEAELECDIRLPQDPEKASYSSSPALFSDPFGKTINKRLICSAGEVKVRDLPEKNRPSDFIGLVGRFEAELTINRNLLRAGEALHCTLSLKGSGNLMSADVFQPPVPYGFHVFPPVVRFALQKWLPVPQGEKTYEWTLIAQKPGQYRIGPYRFSFFDPSTRTYQSSQTADTLVTVLPSLENRTDTTREPLFISFPEDIQTEWVRHKRFWRTHPILFWSLLLIPPLIPVFPVILQLGIRFWNSKRQHWRKKTMHKRLTSKIHKIRNSPWTDSRVAYRHLKVLFDEYLHLQYDIALPIRDLSTVTLAMNLKHVSPNTMHCVAQIYERLETGLYAPDTQSVSIEEDIALLLTLLSKKL